VREGKMKKLVALIGIAVFVAFMANSSMALSLVGWANPLFNPDTPSSLTGTVIYSFSLTGSPGEMINVFNLDFPISAFASISNFTMLSGPSGFYLTSPPGPWHVRYYSLTNFIPVGTTFSFQVDFTLTVPRTDPNYNTALIWGATNTAWEQNFYAYNTSDPFGGAGGSTGLVPEPTSLILLGSGLIGIGVFSRMIRRRR